MERLRVGLIGTGFMGKTHALAWRNLRAVMGDGPEVLLEHYAISPPTRPPGLPSSSALPAPRGIGAR